MKLKYLTFALLSIFFIVAVSSSALAAPKAKKTKSKQTKEVTIQDPAKEMVKLGDEISKIANDGITKLQGKYINIIDNTSFSSGNILADAMFNAGSKFEIIYNVKVENVDAESRKMVVKIIDGEIYTKQDTLGSGNKGRAAEVIENNRGKEMTRSMTADLNGILWKAHENAKYKKEHLLYAIWLSEKASEIGEIDTACWVLADNGFPRSAVFTYEAAIEKYQSQGKDASKYKQYLQDIISKGNVENDDKSSDAYKKAVVLEFRELKKRITL